VARVRQEREHSVKCTEKFIVYDSLKDKQVDDDILYKKETMKPNNTNIANYYGITRQTVGTWKKSTDDKIRKHYEALRDYFIEAEKAIEKDKRC